MPPKSGKKAPSQQQGSKSSIAKGKLIVHNQKIETKVQEVAFSQYLFEGNPFVDKENIPTPGPLFHQGNDNPYIPGILIPSEESSITAKYTSACTITRSFDDTLQDLELRQQRKPQSNSGQDRTSRPRYMIAKLPPADETQNVMDCKGLHPLPLGLSSIQDAS